MEFGLLTQIQEKGAGLENFIQENMTTILIAGLVACTAGLIYYLRKSEYRPSTGDYKNHNP